MKAMIALVVLFALLLSIAPQAAQGGYAPSAPSVAAVVAMPDGSGAVVYRDGTMIEATVAENTFTASWSSGGVKIVVTVPKRDDESSGNWAVRCKTAVDSMKATFPVDPATGGVRI